MHVSRWLTPLVLSTGLALGAVSTPAQAEDAVARVLVDVADVIIRGGAPYYRHGNYDGHDRLIVQHDHHGRPIYYRTVYRTARYDYHDRSHRIAYDDHGRRASHSGLDRGHNAQHDRRSDREHDRHERRDRSDHGRRGH